MEKLQKATLAHAGDGRHWIWDEESVTKEVKGVAPLSFTVSRMAHPTARLCQVAPQAAESLSDVLINTFLSRLCYELPQFSMGINETQIIDTCLKDLSPHHTSY